MGIKQDHAVMLGDPIQFPFPDVGSCFAQEKEKGGILGQGVGEFDVAF